MKILLAFLMVYTFYVSSYADCVNKPTVIAVIDTGFGLFGLGKEAKLCKFGHRDFSDVQKFTTNYTALDPVPTDEQGHGTNIVGVIQNFAGESNDNYCFVILKYYNKKSLKNMKSSTEAIKYATKIKADYINYSGGGTDWEKSEKNAVANFIKSGGKFIAAAGNEYADIDEKDKHYYPALYPGVISVGALSKTGIRLSFSNHGKSVKAWEVGEEVEGFSLTMSGTSQAAAIETGKMVAKEKPLCH